MLLQCGGGCVRRTSYQPARACGFDLVQGERWGVSLACVLRRACWCELVQRGEEMEEEERIKRIERPPIIQGRVSAAGPSVALRAARCATHAHARNTLRRMPTLQPHNTRCEIDCYTHASKLLTTKEGVVRGAVSPSHHRAGSAWASKRLPLLSAASFLRAAGRHRRSVCMSHLPFPFSEDCQQSTRKRHAEAASSTLSRRVIDRQSRVA